MTTDRHDTEKEGTTRSRTTPSTSNWEYEGNGSRYVLRGRSPSVVVILGWDRPLNTFFAQVWDSAAKVEEEEEAEPVEWLGTSLGEICDIATLREALSSYADLPEDLARQVCVDRENGGRAS